MIILSRRSWYYFWRTTLVVRCCPSFVLQQGCYIARYLVEGSYSCSSAFAVAVCSLAFWHNNSNCTNNPWAPCRHHGRQGEEEDGTINPRRQTLNPRRQTLNDSRSFFAQRDMMEKRTSTSCMFTFFFHTCGPRRAPFRLNLFLQSLVLLEIKETTGHEESAPLRRLLQISRRVFPAEGLSSFGVLGKEGGITSSEGVWVPRRVGRGAA